MWRVFLSGLNEKKLMCDTLKAMFRNLMVKNTFNNTFGVEQVR